MGVVINGISISGDINSLKIEDGRVIVNGRDVTPDKRDIQIEVHGDVGFLSVDTCNTLSITGNAGSVKTLAGPVSVGGDVTGSVKTMSGPVRCREIQGDVSTMTGSITRSR